MTDSASLAVVIIGRNEGERLRRCLESVQQMDNPFASLDIIYVDSDSTDNSPSIAAEFGARVLTVKPERPAAAIGRNAGWQAATADYVLFLDGDTILNPQFVRKAWESLQSDDWIAVVFGHRRELDPKASIYQQALDLDWIYPLGDFDFCGGDALMRRDVLQAVGGYNPDLIAGEEPEMCQRMRARGYKIRHIDQAMTLHDLALHRWSQYWRRSVRTGHAYAEVSNLLSDTPEPLWKDAAAKNWRNAAIILGLAGLSVLASIGLMSVLPVLLFIGFFLAISVRSAWKNRWKTEDKMTLFWYGLHSQFQHLPIAFGQLNYYWLRRKGQRQRLIEYK